MSSSSMVVFSHFDLVVQSLSRQAVFCAHPFAQLSFFFPQKIESWSSKQVGEEEWQLKAFHSERKASVRMKHNSHTLENANTGSEENSFLFYDEPLVELDKRRRSLRRQAVVKINLDALHVKHLLFKMTILVLLFISFYSSSTTTTSSTSTFLPLNLKILLFVHLTNHQVARKSGSSGS